MEPDDPHNNNDLPVLNPPLLAQGCRKFKWKVQLMDANEEFMEEEMLTTKDVYQLHNRKVIVHFDEDSGQPDEDSGGLLASWLGQLCTDVKLLPIDYSDWRRVPAHIKDRAWEFIQAKFWFHNPALRKGYVISALGNRCKDFKQRLWKEYKKDNYSETVENCPEAIPEDQWRHLVDMRFTDDWKAMQKRNTTSQKKNRTPHSCGRRSFARTRRSIKKITGKAPCRAEFFIETRKKADGTFICDEAKKFADELTLLMAQNPPTSSNVTACLDDDFSRVFGPESSGRVRCVGRGPTPSKLIKRLTVVRSEAENAKIDEMTTKITTLEEISKKQQEIIARLISNSHLPNNQPPPQARLFPNNQPSQLLPNNQQEQQLPNNDQASQWAAFENMMDTSDFSNFSRYLSNFPGSSNEG